MASVSIHAPVTGRDCRYLDSPERTIVSIHAPVRGATSRSRSGAVAMLDSRFNPRARTGRDTMRR